MSQSLVDFKRNLGDIAAKGELALPSNVSEEAFRNAAIIAVQDNAQILQCDQQSVFKSVRTLAGMGLVPDGREAALVPFNTKVDGAWVKKCQAMPMVFGLIKMARRSGDVRDIRAHIVYQNEYDQGRFEYVVGDEERLEHEPILFGDKGPAIGCYAIAKLKDGTLVRTFMDADQIDKIRRLGASQRVKGGKVSDTPIGIWEKHEEEMWKKTVIRRLSKRLDLSSEDLRQIQSDEDIAPMKDVTPEETEHKNLAAKLKEPKQPDPEPAGDTIDAEPVHWTVNVDTSDAAPMDPEFDEGGKAFKDGTTREDCPYTDHRTAAPWLAGWDEQKKLTNKGDQ